MYKDLRKDPLTLKYVSGTVNTDRVKKRLAVKKVKKERNENMELVDIMEEILNQEK